MRFSLSASLAIAIATCATAAAAASTAGADACRPEYIVPYSEQCDFAYRNIRKDQSVQSVATAYDTCARAQSVAVVCVKSPSKQIHAVAASALYRDVGEQAEIALFAQHFPLAEALLREKNDVLRVLQTDRPKDDPALARERASIALDLRDAKTGECTTAALQAARTQGQLGKEHKYADLADMLFTKSQAYGACSAIATTPAKRAYVNYQALVALEESGRAAQANGDTETANERYMQCLSKTNVAGRDASTTVRGYIATVHSLCKQRMLGAIPVDKPEPLDQDAGKSFRPLGLPQ